MKKPSSGYHFWQTARILLNYRRQLALGLAGVIVSAGCFGAGLGMILPIMHVLIQQQQALEQLVYKHIGGGPEARGRLLDPLGDRIADIVPDDPFHAFLMVVSIILVLTVVGNIGRYIHGLMAITIAQRATMRWRDLLFARLVNAPLTSSFTDSSTDNVSRLLNDTARLSGGYHAVIGRGALELAKVIAALSVAIFIDWRLTLIALLGAPLIGITTNILGRKIRRAAHEVLVKTGALLGHASAALANARVVKSHNAQGYERRRFRRLSRNMFNEEMTMRQARAMASPINETISLFGVIVVASISAWLVLRGQAKPAEFMAVMGLLVAAGSSIKPLTNLHNEIKEAEAGAERVMLAMQTPNEPIAPDVRSQHPSLPRHARDVTFENVSFKYPNAVRPAVSEVHLHVAHGQRVAIVGGNGSGKTTLLSLLARLLEPATGRVLIDSQDIREVNLRSLRDQLAIVTQDSVLFEGTIAANIAYGRQWTPRRDIEAAATAAFADDFIRNLPHGYDTLLGEYGSGLSGGQRQRLCIARAILRDPAILILDEATSQIDADSEEKINRAIQNFSRGRTTFVIAHRLSTVIDCDLIVVMDQGRILDQGTHRQLLERCHAYRVLTQTQLQPIHA